jgi:hypothetical protein
MLPELQRQAAQAVVQHAMLAATQAREAIRKIQRNFNRRMILEQFLFRVAERY